jgi:hypothetical protein
LPGSAIVGISRVSVMLPIVCHRARRHSGDGG